MYIYIYIYDTNKGTHMFIYMYTYYVFVWMHARSAAQIVDEARVCASVCKRQIVCRVQIGPVNTCIDLRFAHRALSQSEPPSLDAEIHVFQSILYSGKGLKH